MPQPKDKNGWMNTKTRPLYMLSTRDPPQNKGHIQTESERLEKDISCKWRPNKAGVAILISDKMDFEIKAKNWKKRSHSVQFSRSVMSDSLQPHEPQHARPPCPSPTAGVHPNPCPLSRWCHLTISSSVIPFSSCLQSFPTSGSSNESALRIR